MARATAFLLRHNILVPSLCLTQAAWRTSTSQSLPPTMAGKKSVEYFVNWGIYGCKFPPSMISVEDLTLLYAFANFSPSSGAVALSDSWANAELHYPGNSWNDVRNNLYGNFQAIYNPKKANRHPELLLSIGGWTYSPSFHCLSNPWSSIPNFAPNLYAHLSNYSKTTALMVLTLTTSIPRMTSDRQAQGYAALLWGLRHALDHHAQRKGSKYRFLLTIAAPCGTDNYQQLRVREMNQFLDFWSLMAYDFAGSQDCRGHQSNLLGPSISVSQAVDFQVGQGTPPANLITSIPLYGRSFVNTQEPGRPFNGIGPGSWEAGVYDYRALPLPGTHIFRDDEQMGASWVYDYNKKEMISFDDEKAGHWEGKWIRKMGLGGSMIWELSGNKGAPRPDMEGGLGKEPQQPWNNLDAMGGLQMDELNWLSCKGSKFDNMRKGKECIYVQTR
ncbi:glycoside hydrolase family 18 protein [Cylindrobasidium torrendii FP15055 ss-10]|uniref:chitinase n=1 Tax=Cylindrobasidium torrendii FP15055 ss-10 TaxID=1314674 RepID=A0A0D7AY86_9AGAR|nr:glycoside hydrolase family 18 protein [Cylindrobasidium torrendii FP15055 ss-10]